MKNLELLMEMIDSMEGLDVSFKFGKESELVIKGDFKAILKAVGTVVQAQTNSENARKKIEELEGDILR